MINPSNFGRIDPKEWRRLPVHYTQPHWPDKLPHDPAHYGDNDFHARTHPEIIAVALQRYTKPGDVVWDPMAGSGTTEDVCANFKCTCISSDLLPTRDSIVKADARTWAPSMMVDMVVLHPPYLDIVEWDADGTLAVSQIRLWRQMMHQVIDNATEALKLNHVLVLIVGQVYKDQQTLCLDCELYPKMQERYRLLGRVVRGFGETKGGATSGAKNENLWKYRRLKYGIWGLGIDVVMFWQRTS
jgi:hypothetical protein